MRLLFAVVLTFVVAALGSVGCTPKDAKTSPPAGGGGGGGGGAEADKDFKLAPAAKDIAIKVGKDHQVTLKIERGKEFKDKVAVDLTVEEGKVKVDPAKLEIAEGKSEATFKITVEAGAKEGDFEIHVSAVAGAKKHDQHIKGKIEK